MPNQPIQAAEVIAVRKLLRRKEGATRLEIADRLQMTPRRVTQIIDRIRAKVVRVVGRTQFFKEPGA